MLVAYACDPTKTKGRVFHEEMTLYRNEYERDKDRIIRSNAFKRLQYKTQLFINLDRDHYRNRLTHSIEVSTVARSIAKYLKLSTDLAESVSLAHDLGHSPFGHVGEVALNKCMQNYGGFSHNAHTFKLLTKLERKYASYEGLNLTWEVLEGIIKHNGPLTNNIPTIIQNYARDNDMDLSTNPSLEAQLASLADDIAYICHDLEDIIKSGLIRFDDIAELPFLEIYLRTVRDKFGQNIEPSRLIYEITRSFMAHLINNLLVETTNTIKRHNLTSVDDVRKLNYYLVSFPEHIQQNINTFKKFLVRRLYHHPKMLESAEKAQKIIEDLFNYYINNSNNLPIRWQNLVRNTGEHDKANIIADYIAGMTDRYAIKLHDTIINKKFYQ